MVNALHQKKYRKENRLFITEGIKSINEFIQSEYVIDTIYCSPAAVPKLVKFPQKVKLFESSETDLKKISTLNTPAEALAIVQIPLHEELNIESLQGEFNLLVDNVQDPGNLGTIIRTADWFGFKRLVCSASTVDVYNPKVVQASMGSLSRLKVYYTELDTLISQTRLPVYGAVLDGSSLYKTSFEPEGLILVGNEGNGISSGLLPFITHKVTIPSYGNAESLNVAMSAAILCSELRRQQVE